MAEFDSQVYLLSQKFIADYPLSTFPKVDPFYSEANISYLKDITSAIDSGYAVLAEHDVKSGT